MPSFSFRLLFLLVMAVVAGGTALGQSLLGASHAADHIVIKFGPGVRGQLRPGTRLEKLEQLRGSLGLGGEARLIEPPLHRLLPPSTAAGGTNEPDLSKFYYLRVPPGLSVD